MDSDKERKINELKTRLFDARSARLLRIPW